jgi:hypothetical protein
VIEQYAARRPSHGQIDIDAIVDVEKDHDEVVQVGWDNERRVHGSVIRLDVIDGKVWIQHSWPRAYPARISCWDSTRPWCDTSLDSA